ncbi:MAG TPA: hypothetical protein VLG92_02700 [Candidatus Saccharimonadia bacterium]|nr:hypothetical protein [Candidatus Saccharimonadia bacterium]
MTEALIPPNDSDQGEGVLQRADVQLGAVPPRRPRSIINLGGPLDPKDRIKLPDQGLTAPSVDQAEGVSPDIPVPLSVGQAEQRASVQVTAGEASEDEDLQAEIQHDAEVRYTDIELLGKSFRVRRNVTEGGRKAIRLWDRAWAAVGNTLDRPGQAMKWYAQNRAESAYGRKVTRLEDAQDRFHASSRLVERRQTAATEAARIRDEKRRTLQDHKDVMTKRVTTIHEEATQRRESYLANKKAAVENKLARQAVRGQLRGEGASRQEARDILAEIPAEHLARVGKVAIVAEASRAAHESARHSRSKATKARERNERRITATGERAERYDRATADADEITEQLSTTVLPFTERYITVLRDKLASMTEETAGYQHLVAELQAAEGRLAVQQRELGYWQGVSQRKSGKAGKSKARVSGLEKAHAQHEIKVSQSIREADIQELTHEIDKAELEGQVRVVLNPEKKPRKAA